MLRFGTVNGAEHLGLGGRTGTLTPGKQADIVLLDATALNVGPLNGVPGAAVSLMDRTNVETVIVAGEVRKWRGRLLGAVLDRLRRELEASRDYLFKAAGVTQGPVRLQLGRLHHRTTSATAQAWGQMGCWG